MDDNSKKEEFSYAYIRALVASCGYIFSPSTRPEDNRGFDFSIIGDEVHDVGAPRIMVQAKCTTPKNFHDFDDVYKYDLEVKNYNKLKQKSIDPSYLFVVVVPEKIEEWICIDESSNKTVIKHNAYYVSLQGSKKVNNKDTIRVAIPKENLLNRDNLTKIMVSNSDLRSKIMSMIDNVNAGK